MNQQTELLEQLLEIGFERHNDEFADGQLANNKLELDHQRLSQHLQVYEAVVGRICELAEPYKPEFVIGVPHGATGLAGKVALELGNNVYNPVLKIDKAAKTMDYATQLDRSIVERLDRGLLVEDVPNRRSSIQRALRVPDLAAKISVVLGVFDRGLPDERKSVDKPVHSIVALEIPAILPSDSELWNYLQ